VRLPRSVWLTAGAITAFHLATAQLYDYHRDEVYYLASGRRLAWGYVDHPPLTPFLYRVSDEVFGASLFGLRVLPAVLHGVIVIVTALIAREFGGDRRAQTVAAIAAAVSPMYLTTGHFLTTVTMELLLWALTILLVTRLVKGAHPRLWLVVGVTVGLGLLDKWTTLYLVAGLGLGLLLTPQRSIMRTPWFAGGVTLALALWAPNLIWQADHDWPQVEMGRSLREPIESLFTVPYQVIFFGASSVFLLWPALRWLLRDDRGREFRSIGIAALVVVVLVMATSGKPYYAAVFGTALLGIGATRLSHDRVRPSVVWMLGIGAAMAPFATPLLPESTVAQLRKVNPEVGEMVGWEEEVAAVAAVYDDHPGATIITRNYSQAGAIELLGDEYGLPQPISGHNSWWWWSRPAGRSDVVISVGLPRPFLERYFGDVELVTVYRSPHGIENIDDGSEICVLRNQLSDWGEIWEDFRFYR
jgi:hypothetical protein